MVVFGALRNQTRQPVQPDTEEGFQKWTEGTCRKPSELYLEINVLQLRTLIPILLGLTACEEDHSKRGESICLSGDNIDSRDTSLFSPNLITTQQTIGAVSPAAMEEAVVVLHVAPNGFDDADGTEKAPLATIAGARDRIREIRPDTGNIQVWLHDGEYVLSETVIFGPEDSGHEDQIIRYAAWPGERPVISSLVPVTGWTKGSNGLMQAPLPGGLSSVRFLWQDSEVWLPRSITDAFITDEVSIVNEGCLECNWDIREAQSARLNTRYPDTFTAPNWRHAEQYDIRTTTISWTQEVLPIKRVDEAEARIYTTIPASLEMRLNEEEGELLNRNWIVNSIEGIDMPGEWAVIDKTIYVMTDDTAYIRVLQLIELIRVDY